MSISEVDRAFQWIYATLTGNSAASAALPGGVHRGIAPTGTLAPYAVYLIQGGSDVGGVAGIRLLNNSLFQIVAYGPASSYLAIASAADAIDAALQKASGSAGADAVVLSCLREQPLAIDEMRGDGTVWTRLGGLYRILTHATV